MANWIQPVLLANGTIGDALAVSTSITEGSGYRANGYAYYAFDSSSSSCLNTFNAGEWIQFVTADTISISSISLSSEGYLPSNGFLQVSDDNGSTWRQVGTWTDTDGNGATATVVVDNGAVTGNFFRIVSNGRSLKYPSKNADIANVSITANLVAFDFTLNFDTSRKVAKPLDLFFDTSRKIGTFWRYENYGTGDLTTYGITLTDLADYKSIYRSAFYQQQFAKCFDIPATNEIWCKFDVYVDPYGAYGYMWRAFNQNQVDSTNGICSYSTSLLFLSSDGNPNPVFSQSNVLVSYQRQTILLHMVSGSSNGVIEAWVDGTLIHTYTGNVNNGHDFNDFFLQSSTSSAIFSNVIISNQQIYFNEIAIADLSINFDTLRQVAGRISISENIDTCRQVIKSTDLLLDTSRKTINSVDFDLDTYLEVNRTVNFDCDTLRKIPHKLISAPVQNGVVLTNLDSIGFHNIEITIAAQQLVDQLKFSTTNNFDIMQQVQGQILDYFFTLRVETSSERGIISTCSCCSDIDELLYTQIAYTLRKETWNGGTYAKNSEQSNNISVINIVMLTPPKANASAHISAIAQKLGLIPVLLFDDFSSSVDINQEGVTYQDLISEIFGWTSRVPHKLINVFIRNNQLFVIQRGHEQRTVNLDLMEISELPTINKTLLRTSFGVTRNSESIERNTGNKKKTSKGHWEMILGNELPEEEQGEDYDEENPEPKEPTRNLPSHVTTVDNDITTDIYYTYDDDGNLTKTTTTTTGGDVDTRVIVENYYDNIKGEKLLYKEVTKEYEYDGEQWELINTKVVNHTYTTVGQQHISAVSDDGSVGGSVTTTARHNDKPTPYDDAKNQDPFYLVDNDGNAYIGSGWGVYTYENGRKIEVVGYEWVPDSDSDTSDTTITGTLDEVLLYDSSFPVNGTDKLREITNDIKWLNRKIQETVFIDIFNHYHIFDCNDKFIFNGNLYYFLSNTFTRTDSITFKQSLQIVRWY